MIPPGCGKKRRVRGLFYLCNSVGKGLETGWEKKHPKEKSIFYKKRQKVMQTREIWYFMQIYMWLNLTMM